MYVLVIFGGQCFVNTSYVSAPPRGYPCAVTLPDES